MDIQQKLSELQKKYEEVENTNQTLTSRLSELYILYNLTRILSTTFDFNLIFKNIFKLFKESLKSDFSSLIFVDDLAEQMNLEKFYGTSLRQEGATILPGKHIHARIVANKNQETNLIDTYEDLDIRTDEKVPLPIYHLGFPLIISNQSVIGSLNFFYQSQDNIENDQVVFYHRITQEVSNILDKIYLFHLTREDTFRDHLTGAYNRRYFNQRLEMEIKRAERYKRHISILMIDIDDFKQINDIYGHVEGDNVLKNMVHVLRNNLRNSDILVRYGGEEFVALLPETNLKNAYIAGEKLRTAVRNELHFRPQNHDEEKKMTISIGVANYPLDAYSAEKLILKADQLLYEAKKNGKNKTVMTGSIK